MIGMILVVILMFFMATLATDSLRWGLGITLFMILAMVSMTWALIVLVLSLTFLFLSEHRPQ
jgi:hypothetical protein